MNFDTDSFQQTMSRWVHTHRDRLVAWRRDLHAHPELSRQELRTTDLILAELTALGLAPRRLPQGTGVTVDLGPQHGPRIGLRADMDALPVAEQTGLPFASTVAGVSHACGHDAHTAVLLATAHALAAYPQLPVGVRLIFQAAEEVMPGGALDAVAAGAAQGLSRIFALHCDPKLAVGQVGVMTGPITSAADHVEVTFRSPGGHTSRPHLTSDLVYAMGAVITGLPAVLSRRVDPRTGTVMVWGAASAGNAANAIPQDGFLRGTVRTADHGIWEQMQPLVTEAIAGLAAPYGVTCQVNYKRGVPPVVNEDRATDIIRRAVAANAPDTIAEATQSGGGEDFSWFLEQVPGAMARLGVWSGSGPQVDLHQSNFDLDERALEVGVRTMTGIVAQAAAVGVR